MEDTLITVETNKLAKEKGFDIKQDITYILEATGEWYESKGVTQSLLQEWLLEVKEINIELTFDDGKWLIYVGRFSYPDSSVEFVGSIECDNFKDSIKKRALALEKGLQEALKLI